MSYQGYNDYHYRSDDPYDDHRQQYPAYYSSSKYDASSSSGIPQYESSSTSLHEWHAKYSDEDYESQYLGSRKDQTKPKVDPNPYLHTGPQHTSSRPIVREPRMMKSISPARETYPCLYAGCEHISSRGPFDLERHMKKHNPPPELLDYPGKGCGRTDARGFSRKDHMREHLRKTHRWDDERIRSAMAPSS